MEKYCPKRRNKCALVNINWSARCSELCPGWGSRNHIIFWGFLTCCCGHCGGCSWTIILRKKSVIYVLVDQFEKVWQFTNIYTKNKICHWMEKYCPKRRNKCALVNINWSARCSELCPGWSSRNHIIFLGFLTCCCGHCGGCSWTIILRKKLTIWMC